MPLEAIVAELRVMRTGWWDENGGWLTGDSPRPPQFNSSPIMLLRVPLLSSPVRDDNGANAFWPEHGFRKRPGRALKNASK